MRTPFQEEREPGARTPFREGVAYFWSIPFLRATIGMIAASNLVAVGAPIALIILAHRQHLSALAIGVFVALSGVALLLRIDALPAAAAALPDARDPALGVLDGARLRRLPRLPERLRARRAASRCTRSGSRTPTRRSRRTRTCSSPTACSDGRWRRRTRCAPRRRRSGRSSPGCCSRTPRRGSASLVLAAPVVVAAIARDAEPGDARPS